MKRRLSAVEARKKLGEVLEGVYYRGDEVIIERAGKPMAVILPMFHYDNMERNRKELWDMIDELQGRLKDVPPEILRQEVDETVDEVRKERREREKRINEKTA
jgi:prevent-host-death family protein